MHELSTILTKTYFVASAACRVLTRDVEPFQFVTRKILCYIVCQELHHHVLPCSSFICFSSILLEFLELIVYELVQRLVHFEIILNRKCKAYIYIHIFKDSGFENFEIIFRYFESEQWLI